MVFRISRLGVGPVTDCWLRLEAAEIEARAGEVSDARRLMESVRRDCGTAGRFGPRLDVLEVRVVLAESGETGG